MNPSQKALDNVIEDEQISKEFPPTLMTPKLVNRLMSIPRLSMSYACIQSYIVLPDLNLEYKCNSLGQSGMVLPDKLIDLIIGHINAKLIFTWLCDIRTAFLLHVVFVS